MRYGKEYSLCMDSFIFMLSRLTKCACVNNERKRYFVCGRRQKQPKRVREKTHKKRFDICQE